MTKRLREIIEKTKLIYHTKYAETEMKLEQKWDDFFKTGEKKGDVIVPCVERENPWNKFVYKKKRKGKKKSFYPFIFVKASIAKILETPKKQIAARFSMLSMMVIMMLPITTVTASTLVIQDGSDNLSESQEATLQEQIETLSEQYDVDMLIITTKEKTGYEDVYDYAVDSLKNEFPDSECSVGVVFDFYESKYSIALQGTALSYITEEEYNALFDYCDEELEKENFSVYNCCDKIVSSCIASINETQREDAKLKEDVQDVANESAKMATASETNIEISEKQVNREKVQIYDYADLLTDTEEVNLKNFVMDTYPSLSHNVLFLTTNDADGKSTMVYSDDYMDALYPNTDENIGFIIDMDNKEFYINTMGTAIQKIDDNEIDEALDAGYSDLKNAKYYDCFKETSEYCLDELTGTSSIKGPGDFFFSLFVGMLSGLIIAAIGTSIIVGLLLARHKKANKAEKAGQYEEKNSYEILDKAVEYSHNYKTVIRNHYKEKSSSSRGGSSHRSSSGRSHGGGGRSF